MFKAFFRRLFPSKDTEPAMGYDLWADAYDNQPDNLMLALDEQIFAELLSPGMLTGKQVIDVGCGTGRHWAKMMAQDPEQLTGYDVSEGMLAKLKEKFPAAETHLLQNDQLTATGDASADVLVSTLTIAHIASLEAALKEWARVLKPGGTMIITDYHPATLARGGKRTFKHEGKTVAIVNHIHPLDKISAIAGQLGFQQLRLIEKQVDDAVRHYYAQQDALDVFEKFKGTSVIYGLLLKLKDAAS